MVKPAIYADCTDLKQIGMLAADGRISGFTTNPSLMKNAGITDYRDFANRVLVATGGKPVSFEVIADDFREMERQANEIASWGKNVYVKIPVTNTLGNPAYDLIWRLAGAGVKVNVTAILTKDQVRFAIDSLRGRDSIISVFAGRIADTGRDPSRIMRLAQARIDGKVKLLWASAREAYNVVQAEEAGCDIITLSPDLIVKLNGFGRNLAEYSLETVRQFHRDAAGLVL